MIVVDALDEADEEAQLVSWLLRPLAGLAHIFLLVGTRPDSAEQGQRFRAFGESAVEIDLDQAAVDRDRRCGALRGTTSARDGGAGTGDALQTIARNGARRGAGRG